jgi:hypothetical protein
MFGFTIRVRYQEKIAKIGRLAKEKNSDAR